MMTFLRKQSQLVLILLLGIIGLGFIFYGSSGTLLTSGGHLASDYGRIGGQELSAAELASAIRETRASFILQGRAQQMTQGQVAEEAWRQLLLQHEADVLHINVSDKQLIEFIQSMPIFQKDGVYSPDAYKMQMAQLQNAFRISPDLFEKIMRNNLRADAVSQALFSTVRTSTGDVSAQYEKFYGPETVSVITFDPKTFAGGVEVKPEEIEAEFKAHPENPAYRTPEKRKVDFILLTLTPEQAKLPENEKRQAVDALGQKALDFVLAFQPNPSATGNAPAPVLDFVAEAKKRGFAPATTDFFTADKTPANVPPSPAFNNTAFELTKESPVSKVVELDNAVAVLHLVDLQPSQARTLDEVKPGITDQLKRDKGSQAAQAAAESASQALQAATAKGTDFKTAAAALNLKVETLPAFVPMTVAQTDPRRQTIAYASVGLTPGQISTPVPVQGDNTTLLFHLDSRGKPDPAGLAAFEARYRQQQDQQLRTMAYVDWANWCNRQPGTRKPTDLDQFVGAE